MSRVTLREVQTCLRKRPDFPSASARVISGKVTVRVHNSEMDGVMMHLILSGLDTIRARRNRNTNEWFLQIGRRND